MYVTSGLWWLQTFGDLDLLLNAHVQSVQSLQLGLLSQKGMCVLDDGIAGAYALPALYKTLGAGYTSVNRR